VTGTGETATADWARRLLLLVAAVAAAVAAYVGLVGLSTTVELVPGAATIGSTGTAPATATVACGGLHTDAPTTAKDLRGGTAFWPCEDVRSRQTTIVAVSLVAAAACGLAAALRREVSPGTLAPSA